ncbi:MAG: hypothetical protein FJ134_14435 [Deltaproteobacteria bacterium]|nr:hypothetical protein [Deltaproteobacteria bacterium]
MITRDIKCGICGYEGKVEALDTLDSVPKSDIFKILGKDSSTGFLHFRCPSCDLDLAVDPLRVIAANQIIGYPESTCQANRLPSIIWGILCLIVAIFILAKFSGWWTYIVAGILFFLAWGFFAPAKQIKEIPRE